MLATPTPATFARNPHRPSSAGARILRHYTAATRRLRGSPPGYSTRSRPFNGNSGYGMCADSISPPHRHMLDENCFAPGFNHAMRPSFGRGLLAGQGNGRF